MKKQISLSLAAAVRLSGRGLWLQCALPDIGPFFVQPGRSGRHHPGVGCYVNRSAFMTLKGWTQTGSGLI